MWQVVTLVLQRMWPPLASLLGVLTFFATSIRTTRTLIRASQQCTWDVWLNAWKMNAYSHGLPASNTSNPFDVGQSAEQHLRHMEPGKSCKVFDHTSIRIAIYILFISSILTNHTSSAWCSPIAVAGMVPLYFMHDDNNWQAQCLYSPSLLLVMKK